MKSPEELMAEHLNGKFFWEHTANTDDAPESKSVMDIRQAQKKFAKGALNVTARNKNPVVVKKEPKRQRIPLKEDQKVFQPIMEAIATAYDISVDDLLGRSTSYKFAKAKQHYYWAIFKYHPKLSSAEAGRIMGKCHTTIMHGRAMFHKKQDFSKVVEVERILGLL